MTCICSYHPSSSLPAQLRLHFLFLMQLLCMNLEHAWIKNVQTIDAKVHCHPMHIECVLFSADTQKGKFGTSSFL